MRQPFAQFYIDRQGPTIWGLSLPKCGIWVRRWALNIYWSDAAHGLFVELS